MYCANCGRDITDELQRRNNFPLCKLEDVLCDFCLGYFKEIEGKSHKIYCENCGAQYGYAPVIMPTSEKYLCLKCGKEKGEGDLK